MKRLSTLSPLSSWLCFGLLVLGGGSLVTAQLAGPTTTSSAAAATHTITVGKGDHRMVPDVVQADVGDIIEFQFFPVNHSVVRAEYMSPCIPIESTGKGKKGFFSGFHPVDAILDNPPKWSVVINDTLPIFYYCSAPGSCINYQMVGVINPNASVSLVSQKQAAKDSKFMLQPGEDFPSEGGPSSTTQSSTATSTSSASSSSAAAASTTAAAAASTGHQGLSSGAIAGIVIGSCAVVLMAAALFFLLGRQKTIDEVIKTRESYAASGLDMRHASVVHPYGSGHTPGSISGSNSDATRKYGMHREYYDSNGYDQRSSGPEEYLAPVPVAARTYSPGAAADSSDDGHPNTPRSPPGSVVGGRTSRQSYTSYTPGDDRLQVGRNMTSASRRGPHELFTPLDEDAQFEDHSAPPSPGRQRPLDGPGGEYRY